MKLGSVLHEEEWIACRMEDEELEKLAYTAFGCEHSRLRGTVFVMLQRAAARSGIEWIEALQSRCSSSSSVVVMLAACDIDRKRLRDRLVAQKQLVHQGEGGKAGVRSRCR